MCRDDPRIGFALDSPLEEAGFELSVPVKVHSCADCLVSGMLIKPRRSDFESAGCSEVLCRAAEPSA
jgi:hypothetical protein